MTWFTYWIFSWEPLRMLTSLFLGIDVRIGVTTFYWAEPLPLEAFLATTLAHVTFFEVV